MIEVSFEITCSNAKLEIFQFTSLQKRPGSFINVCVLLCSNFWATCQFFTIQEITSLLYTFSKSPHKEEIHFSMFAFPNSTLDVEVCPKFNITLFHESTKLFLL